MVYREVGLLDTLIQVVLDVSRNRSSGLLVCLRNVPLMVFRDYFPDRLHIWRQMTSCHWSATWSVALPD